MLYIVEYNSWIELNSRISTPFKPGFVYPTHTYINTDIFIPSITISILGKPVSLLLDITLGWNAIPLSWLYNSPFSSQYNKIWKTLINFSIPTTHQRKYVIICASLHGRRSCFSSLSLILNALALQDSSTAPHLGKWLINPIRIRKRSMWHDFQFIFNWPNQTTHT